MSTPGEPTPNPGPETLRRLEARLAAFEKRLSAVELRSVTRLSGANAGPLPTRPPEVMHVGEQPAEPYDLSSGAGSPVLPWRVEIPAAAPPPLPGATPPAAHAPAVEPAVSRVAEFVQRAQHPAPAGRSEWSLENIIGKSVASWVGALVVLGGVLFFLKYAWDMGWLHLSPEMRVALALLGGAAMVGVGEFLHHKEMRPLAAAIAGAGLAVLMATLFAGNTAFAVPVISRDTAFFGVLLVGASGIVLALHMRAQTLAALALVGMYISPFILNSGADRSVELFIYLLVVTASGLAVNFFKVSWPAVRTLAFVGGWLWLFLWTGFSEFVRANFEAAVAVIALFFSLYVAEMAENLVRSCRADATEGRPETLAVQKMESIVALLSFVNTALAMSLMGVLFYRTGSAGLWVVALGFAGAMGLLTFVTPSARFNLSAGLQAMGLVTLAVPLYFDRLAITGAWGILGLALAIYAYVTGSRAARIWMIIMLGLVAARVLTFDHYLDASKAMEVFRIGDQSITLWILVAWAAAIYSLALAWLSQPRAVRAVVDDGLLPDVGEPIASDEAGDRSTVAAIVIGTLLALAAAAELNTGFRTMALILWCVHLGLLSRLLTRPAPRQMLRGLRPLLLAVISLKWCYVDGLVQRVIDNSHAAPPLWNLFILDGGLLIAAVLVQRSLRQAEGGLGYWWVAALVFTAINVETLRAVDFWMQGTASVDGIGNAWIIKNVALSILWGIIGCTAVMVGFVRKLPPVRWAALALLGITVAKVLLVDMAQVETLLRILSFLVVGGLLLLVSYAYHRVARSAGVETDQGVESQVP